MKIVVRGFGDKRLIFEDHIEFDEQQATQEGLLRMAEQRTDQLMRYQMHMLELEFPDEPNPLKRYFRWGTDKDMMVQPAAINIAERMN